MLSCRLDPRGTDAWGSGAFGAPRGNNKTHKGFDYAVQPGAKVLSPVVGTVTALGYPYPYTSIATNYRYVEVTDLIGNRHRLFYLSPLAYEGQTVTVLTNLGIAQNISDRYQDPDLGSMKPHIHYEVITPSGAFINPENLHV